MPANAKPLQNGVWVEATGEDKGSEHDSPAVVKRRALDKARVEAIKKVTGVSINAGLLSFQQFDGKSASEVIHDLQVVQMSGLIIDERVLEEGCQVQEKGVTFACKVRLKALVVDRTKVRGSGFSVEASLGAKRFFEGDKTRLRIRVTKDASVYAIMVTEESALVLLPNKYKPDAIARANEDFEFPSEEDEKRGLRVVSYLPEGKERSMEVLLVIAIDPAFKLGGVSAGEGVYETVEARGAGSFIGRYLSSLAGIDPSLWTFTQVPYEVLQRR